MVTGNQMYNVGIFSKCNTILLQFADTSGRAV